MSVYTQILNPMTGQMDWQFQTENYDYHQEVARAAFADMLHDTERNKKYFLALEKTINKFHESGKKANVLDIGTGTGLLSMMAVKCGADNVFACEAFLPMAHCAEKIIQANRMNNNINLIKKRSTDIVVGISDTCDMPMRCNILVTEVFDTELIGEGAIAIFNHAHKNLLTDDCVTIPSLGIIYAQIAESALLYSFNKPKCLANLDGGILLQTPKIIENCPGDPSVHDVQLSQLKISDYKLLTKPVKIFSFNFHSKSCISNNENNSVKLEITENGNSQVVFFWWELKMDVEGDIMLSCAPYWVHPDYEKKSKANSIDNSLQNCIPWRDHWIQGIYFLTTSLILSRNYSFYLFGNHDEYSFWFNISRANNETVLFKRPNCTCGFHLAYSRHRIGQINNNLGNKKYLTILENEIDENSVVVSLSEGSLLGLSTIVMGAKKCICFEPNKISRRAIELYVNYNNLKNIQVVGTLDEIDNFSDITHVIAEPYFTTSILPWDNFYFGILLEKFKEKLNNTVKFLPVKANIVVIPVEFIDLYKIRSPIGTCENFNMSIFDDFIHDSLNRTDANIEAQPLWEYPCKALADQQKILSVDFCDFLKTVKNNGTIQIQHNGTCNGIVCWVDWILDDKNSTKELISTGPTQPIQVGHYISWNMFTKQGVHLTPQITTVNSENYVEWEANFQPQKGELFLTFNVK